MQGKESLFRKVIDRLSPLGRSDKEKKLFSNFAKMGRCMAKEGRMFYDLVHDLENAPQYAADIHDIEHECDAISEEMYEVLAQVWVLTFEREDIIGLMRSADDVVDFIWEASQRINLYRLQDARYELYEIAEIIRDMTQTMASLFAQLDTIVKKKELALFIREAHAKESDADKIRDTILEHYYKEAELHPSSIPSWIAWKEVFEHLERATDRFEDIVDILGNIQIKVSS
ncbi:MAG: DUF47 family protein [Candidatus Niyogibacteria bacterium]|nr:DUF47 family protein [Candidatus Niyogibacteria bacterium]